ncbi:outer membrane beta-barrel protein, partial [Photobacterium sanctipauli]
MNNVVKLLPLAILISGTLQAATDNPWYVGARIGGTSFDSVEEPLKGQDLDKDDWGGGVFIGYNVNSWFGLEGGYTYLGQADYANDGFEVQGLDFVGKFTYEVSKSFDIYAKAGGFIFDADNGVNNQDESGVSATAGVGAEYYFSDNLSARLEYQYYNQVGDKGANKPGESDVHFYGLGLVYHWGAPAPVAIIEPEPEPMPEPAPQPQVVQIEAVSATLPFAFDSDALTQADI